MSRREWIGIPLSFLVTYGTFGSAGLGVWFARTIGAVVDTSVEPPEYAVYFDPDGMEGGEGEERAPDDAKDGDPNALAEGAPPSDAPTEPTPEARPPDPDPSETPPTHVPDPVETVPDGKPEVGEPPEVPPPAEQPVAEELPPPTEDAVADASTPTTPGAAGPQRPSRPGGSGTPSTTPADPNRPTGGTPGVDPTKVKDIGDKSGTVNRDVNCEEPHPQIKKLGENHWEIQHDLIDYYTSSIAVFNTLGWSKKYEEGEVKGWQIGGFGCKSPLWKAGLRAKDVLQTVNGHKTNNVVQIIGLWLGSKKYGDFEVVLLRKGQPLTLRYTVPKDAKKSKPSKP